MPIILREQKSNGGKIYAKLGEKVSIFKSYEHNCIAETLSGVRFPCLLCDLGEEPEVKVDEKLKVVDKPAASIVKAAVIEPVSNRVPDVPVKSKSAVKKKPAAVVKKAQSSNELFANE